MEPLAVVAEKRLTFQPEGLTAFRAVHCSISRLGDYGLVSHGLYPIMPPFTSQELGAPRFAIRSLSVT